jgi:hypothetical protein
MVVVPETLSESCEKLESTLQKLQPKFGLRLKCTEAQAFLIKLFPAEEKSVKLAMNKLRKSSKLCQACQCKLDDASFTIIFHSFDWDEVSYSPSELRVLCSACAAVCSWDKLMQAHLNEVMLQKSEGEFSSIVEKSLKLNGLKISDVASFNAALSVFASLRVCESELATTLHLGDHKSASSLIDSLVSKH